MNKNTPIDLIAIFIVAAVLTGIGVFFRAWIISILYGWMIISFPSLPVLTIPQIVVISGITTLVDYRYIPSKDRDMWMPLVSMFCGPIVVLGVCWFALKAFG